jgi:Ca2+-binding RTX toxin-like protein
MSFNKSGINNIDALLSGKYWNSTGKAVSLTYSISDGSENPLSSAQIAMVQEAFRQWSEVARITFTPVASGGHIRISGTDGSSGLAKSTRAGRHTQKLSHVNISLGNQSKEGIGNWFLQLALHEIGHALGLKHPGNYNLVDGEMKNGTPPFLPYADDNNTNTIMSYNSKGAYAATPMAYDIRAIQYLYGARPQNAGNTTYRFDTVHSYNDGTQPKGLSNRPMKLTLWDSGGVDTLDFSRLASKPSGYHFDIREGGILTTKDALDAEKYPPKDNGRKDISDKKYQQKTTSFGTAIAFGAQIENVTGSSSDDTIHGNGLANTLRGGAGNDKIYGHSGNDELYGGAGDDILYGDSDDSGNFLGRLLPSLEWLFPDNDSLYGGADNDTLYGGRGDDYLDGGTGNDTMYGGKGNDRYIVDSPGDRVVEYAGEGADWVFASIHYTLPNHVEHLKLIKDATIGVGNSLNNFILGNEANNYLYGYGGDDHIYGGGGNDHLYGGDGNDILEGGFGNDNLYGGNDHDVLYGEEGDDYLFGEAGDDRLIGGSGRDVLVGGLGHDTLIGDADADTFYFLRPNEGTDFIQDFNRAEGDKIQILARGFGGGLIAGQLGDSQFILGASATSSSHRFIFNTSNNILSFDPDGAGGVGAQELAKVSSGVTLRSSDIWVL